VLVFFLTFKEINILHIPNVEQPCQRKIRQGKEQISMKYATSIVIDYTATFVQEKVQHAVLFPTACGTFLFSTTACGTFSFFLLLRVLFARNKSRMRLCNNRNACSVRKTVVLKKFLYFPKKQLCISAKEPVRISAEDPICFCRKWKFSYRRVSSLFAPEHPLQNLFLHYRTLLWKGPSIVGLFLQE